MIEIKYLRQLLELFDQSSAQELRIEQEEASIRLSKRARREEAPVYPQFQFPQMGAPMAAAHAPSAAGGNGATAAHAPAPAVEPVEDTSRYHEIRSPIVGTFYRAPNPESPNFVEVGQEVSPGQVLCIVEAMKLMNEIECDVYGKVMKIVGENAQPVDYNQALFLIDPS